MCDFITRPIVNEGKRIGDAIEQAVKGPSEENKSKLKQISQKGANYSLAVLTASVALTILGVLSLASGGLLGVGLGMLLVLVSLPTMYCSYNTYRLYGNLEKVAENPAKYIHNNPQATINKELLRKDLKANTVGFDALISTNPIDLLVNSLK